MEKIVELFVNMHSCQSVWDWTQAFQQQRLWGPVQTIDRHNGRDSLKKKKKDDDYCHSQHLNYLKVVSNWFLGMALTID